MSGGGAIGGQKGERWTFGSDAWTLYEDRWQVSVSGHDHTQGQTEGGYVQMTTMIGTSTCKWHSMPFDQSWIAEGIGSPDWI